MLKYLKIQNIILVEQTAFPVHPGLNILTGETGSGKSAIMHGLSLAIGERADAGLVRRGCDKGIVEALFETDHPDVIALLEAGGIEHDPSQELIIRREIRALGKGRIFINNQVAQITFLRKLGFLLVRIVGQHATQSLFSTDYHREIVDLFGGLHVLLQSFQESYEKENQTRGKLTSLIQQESQRLREIDICTRELQELEEAQIKPGEEEELFAEYTLLSHAEEVSNKVFEINQALSGDRTPLLVQLNRQKQALESLVQIDPSLQETLEIFRNAALELHEASRTLSNYQNGLHFNPERLAQIDERLTLLNRLKKKYGGEIETIQSYQEATQSKLERLQNAENEIEELKMELKDIEERTSKLSEELSEQRGIYSLQLQKALSEQLASLNMPKSEFIIRLSKEKRTKEGDERIEFFLRPNVGEREIAIKEGASGGEISRILFALQTLLAGKERTSTLIFDEVDANIGGETATIIGERLQEISRQHQVICITHFPQVASHADHHFQISKEEKAGRTVTLVQELDSLGRQQELTRMSGSKLVGQF